MSYSKRCKENGIKLELTWFNARKKWKSSKGYSEGFPIWYSKGEATRHDTKAGYESALHEWVIEQAKRDATRPHADVWHHHKRLFEQIQAVCFEPQLSKDVTKFLDSIEKVLAEPKIPERIGVGGLSKRFKAEFCSCSAAIKTGVEAMLPTAVGGNDFGSLSYRLPDKWTHLIELHSTSGVNRPQTVRYWAERYLELTQEKASVNQRSDVTYSSSKQTLGIFRNFIGDEAHIRSITGVRWDDYYKWLLRRTDIAATTKRNYRNAGRTFLKWAWRQDECELTELPNNIDDRSMTFIDIAIDDDDEVDGEDDYTPELYWDKADFLKALNSNEINAHFKCWILLMLNCGFTQTDINDIRHRQLKLDENRLIHKRTKTKRNPNPPKVNYLLWNSTVTAIKEVMTTEGKWAFLMTRGSRLCPRKTVETGSGELKTTTYDNVSRMWGKMKKAGKEMPDKQLKGLRKTGSATVKEFDIEMRGLYLGHVGGIADKHYDPKSGKPYKPLDEAIQYLGWKYGQCDPPPQRRELTPEMILSLQEAGFDI